MMLSSVRQKMFVIRCAAVDHVPGAGPIAVAGLPEVAVTPGTGVEAARITETVATARRVDHAARVATRAVHAVDPTVATATAVVTVTGMMKVDSQKPTTARVIRKPKTAKRPSHHVQRPRTTSRTTERAVLGAESTTAGREMALRVLRLPTRITVGAPAVAVADRQMETTKVCSWRGAE